MLIEFSVGNYKSFKDIATFSMVAAPLTAKDKTLDENNVFTVDEELKLLKSAVMYGANASGKSNFVTAVNFMREMVLNSSKNTQANEPISIEPFLLSSETAGKPAHFEMVFRLDGRVYRYGFEVNQTEVVNEWLFYTPKSRETKLFKRQNGHFSISSTFKEGKTLVEQTRNNALFLSVVAQFNGAIAIKTLQWFNNLIIVSGLDNAKLYNWAIQLFTESKYSKHIAELVIELDTGISNLELRKNPFSRIGPSAIYNIEPNDPLKEIKENLQKVEEQITDFATNNGLVSNIISTTHIVFDARGNAVKTVEFEMTKQESAGTNQMFSLGALAISALENGRVLIIDELNARLHTLITQKFVALFNSNQTNPHHAQLVFTTHDTNLLSKEIFRRDQIWFAEKNQVHSTVLYSLAEFKIRNDASFEKDYILGRYGAIPFIGDLTNLWGENEHG